MAAGSVHDRGACARSTAGVPLAGLAGRALRWLFTGLERARARARLRRDLERLDAHMLHDIGARREDLVREAYRPFWRP